MKKRLKFLAVVSLLLAILMFVEVPIGAVAPVLGSEEPSSELVLSEPTETQTTEGTNEIISEVEKERTEYSKTFRLSNGNCMVAQYNMPVHYKDDKGKWADYDNSLSVTEQEVSILETQPAVIDEATADSVAVVSTSEGTTYTTNRKTEKKQMFKNRRVIPVFLFQRKHQARIWYL